MTTEQKQARKVNRELDTNEIVNRLSKNLKPYAYIVGRWVWASFAEKPEQDLIDELKILGFNWNNKRKVWQHPCGWHCKSAPYDPRNKYRTMKIEDLEAQV